MFNRMDMAMTGQPLYGKTYSLFGNKAITGEFYERAERIAGRILLEEGMTELQLRDFICRSGQDKRHLRSIRGTGPGDTLLKRIMELLHEEFRENITGIESHLRSTPFHRALRDRPLRTIREQYYLYMIEFVLVNRIHIGAFLEARYRIALLPYCLREDQDGCKEAAGQVDFRCTACRGDCQVNQVSRLLRKNHIDPYIWQTARLKTLLKQLVSKHGSVGVLGIACIVELVAGMRKVMAGGIPVVGIPLNANRCPRWMGEFHETSVDLQALEKLIRNRNS